MKNVTLTVTGNTSINEGTLFTVWLVRTFSVEASIRHVQASSEQWTASTVPVTTSPVFTPTRRASSPFCDTCASGS